MKNEEALDIIDYFTKLVCAKCNYYNKSMGVCSGEILPIDRAILRNIDGRGTCNDIKEIAKLLKEQRDEYK